MNNEHQENGALRGPLIFTVPASHFPFLVALNVGWLEKTDWEKKRGRGVQRKPGSCKNIIKAVVGIHVLRLARFLAAVFCAGCRLQALQRSEDLLAIR